MIKTILGTKLNTTQKFAQDGRRLTVTEIKAGPCYVVQIKTQEKDGYNSIQFGFGEKKMTKTSKPLKGHFKKAGLKTSFLYLKEVKLDSKDLEKLKIGDELKVADIFKTDDKIKVTGWTKGKGFAGVVKRWHFKGGPRTHGQSDRERSPGSIGQTTTPGRVYKGKKMAGRMGNARVTVPRLKVVDVNEKDNLLTIKGVVPGAKNGLLIIQKYA